MTLTRCAIVAGVAALWACDPPSKTTGEVATQATPRATIATPFVSEAAPPAVPPALPPLVLSSAPTPPLSDGGCVCVTHSIEWGGTRGLYDFHTYTLKPCKALADVSLEWRCAGTANCNPGRDGSTAGIVQALADPDVVRALARAPVTFGHANELAEGSDGYHFSVDGKEVVVFEGCGVPEKTPCELPPPGVLAARNYLRDHSVEGPDLKCTKR